MFGVLIPNTWCPASVELAATVNHPSLQYCCKGGLQVRFPSITEHKQREWMTLLSGRSKSQGTPVVVVLSHGSRWPYIGPTKPCWARLKQTSLRQDRVACALTQQAHKHKRRKTWMRGGSTGVFITISSLFLCSLGDLSRHWIHTRPSKITLGTK